MEGGLDYVRTPLLSTEGQKPNENVQNQESNLFSSLKSDFFSKLPEKLRSGLNPEALLHLDLTKTTGLMEGISKSLFFWLID